MKKVIIGNQEDIHTVNYKNRSDLLKNNNFIGMQESDGEKYMIMKGGGVENQILIGLAVRVDGIWTDRPIQSSTTDYDDCTFYTFSSENELLEWMKDG